VELTVSDQCIRLYFSIPKPWQAPASKYVELAISNQWVRIPLALATATHYITPAPDFRLNCLYRVGVLETLEWNELVGALKGVKNLDK
jgi:hypothetical protein